MILDESAVKERLVSGKMGGANLKGRPWIMLVSKAEVEIKGEARPST